MRPTSVRVIERRSDSSFIMEASLLPNEDSITSFTPLEHSADLLRVRLAENTPKALGSIAAAGAAACGAFLFGYSMGFSSPTLTAMEVLKKDAAFCDGQLKDLGDSAIIVTSSEAAQFSSIVNAGAIVGSVLGGLLCDAVGRRTTILLAAPLFGGMWVLTAAADSYLELMIGRAAVGIGVGMVSLAVPLYISETSPTNLRGTLGSVNQLAVTTGMLASSVLGILVATDQETSIACTESATDDAAAAEQSISLNEGAVLLDTQCDDFVPGWKCGDFVEDSSSGTMVGSCSGDLPHWRMLAWAAAMFAVPLFCLMLAMPETPPWLLKKKKVRKARLALMFLRSHHDLHVDHELKELERSLTTEDLQAQRRSAATNKLPARLSSYDPGTMTGHFSTMHSRRMEEGGDGDADDDDNDQQCSMSPSTLDDNEDNSAIFTEVAPGSRSDRAFSTGFETAKTNEKSSCCGGGREDSMSSAVSISLCSEELRRPMAVAIAMMAFQQLSGINAVIFFSGQILQAAGMENANVGVCIVMAVQVCFSGVAVMLMDRAGRRVLMAISAAGMAIAALCIAVFFANHKRPSWLAFAAMILYIISFSLGMGPVPWLYMGEVFPAHARSKACSTATIVNWSLSFVVTLCFDKAQVALTPAGCFAFFASVCIVCLIFVGTVMPETKGKTIDEIQEEFATRENSFLITPHIVDSTFGFQRRSSFEVR